MGKTSSFFSRGFTLIELLIVIAVIGVLAAGVITLLNPLAQIQKSRDAQRMSDLSQIQKALEIYYSDFGAYPAANNNKIAGIDWGLSWSPYMGTLPGDPDSPTSHYAYCTSDSGQSYYLYANLRRGGSITTNKCGASTICGSGVQCNYGVSSPNVSP